MGIRFQLSCFLRFLSLNVFSLIIFQWLRRGYHGLERDRMVSCQLFLVFLISVVFILLSLLVCIIFPVLLVIFAAPFFQQLQRPARLLLRRRKRTGD